jgi:hypothetical protein
MYLDSHEELRGHIGVNIWVPQALQPLGRVIHVLAELGRAISRKQLRRFQEENSVGTCKRTALEGTAVAC